MYYEYHNVRIYPYEQIGAHTQLTWELNLIIIGSGVRYICGQQCVFGRGDTVLLPPGVEHQWTFSGSDTDSNGRIHNISLLFSDEFIKNLIKALPDIGNTLASVIAKREISIFRGETRNRIEKLLVSMVDMTSEQRAIRIPELILMLCNISDKEIIVTRRRLSDVERKIERLRIYCLCNFMQNIGISDAATHVGMNKSALCRFMKQRFGMPFTAYINHLRIECACNKLRATDKTIASIAYECGFNNIPYFNRLFKEKLGKSPDRYRKGDCITHS